MKVKLLGVAALATAALTTPQAANADAVSDFYQSKTLKVVIGSRMGGAYGLYSQLLSRHVSKYLPGGPTVDEIGAAGGRRVSIGGSLASTAYGALMAGARELLATGTSTYLATRLTGADRAELR